MHRKFKCSTDEPVPNEPACEELILHTEIDAQVDIARVGGSDCYLPKHNTHGWCYVKEKKRRGKKRKSSEEEEEDGEAEVLKNGWPSS